MTDERRLCPARTAAGLRGLTFTLWGSAPRGSLVLFAGLPAKPGDDLAEDLVRASLGSRSVRLWGCGRSASRSWRVDRIPRQTPECGCFRLRLGGLCDGCPLRRKLIAATWMGASTPERPVGPPTLSGKSRTVDPEQPVTTRKMLATRRSGGWPVRASRSAHGTGADPRLAAATASGGV